MWLQSTTLPPAMCEHQADHHHHHHHLLSSSYTTANRLFQTNVMTTGQTAVKVSYNCKRMYVSQRVLWGMKPSNNAANILAVLLLCPHEDKAEPIYPFSLGSPPWPGNQGLRKADYLVSKPEAAGKETYLLILCLLFKSVILNTWSHHI